ILKSYCQELAREINDDRWERIAEPIERAVVEQKHLPPNVDWPSARLYHYMGLRAEVYTAIFAVARAAGSRGHRLVAVAAECKALPLHGTASRSLHAHLRDGPRGALGGPLHRADRSQSPDEAPWPVH